MSSTNLILGDCKHILKTLQDNSVDMIITSPPYYNLRDYGAENQIGLEETYTDYIDSLVEVFEESKRVLKDTGSLWINIDDVYVDTTLLGIPDRLKIKLIDNGWICRNEIIWHKPNAMPSSCKTRFNSDYEKLYFFTKCKNYYFETQYEPVKSVNRPSSLKELKSNLINKYRDIDQESSVRQGMNKNRGNNIVYLRKDLPTQEEFVSFIRNNISVDELVSLTNIKRTTVEHWFRKDNSGFAYPSIEDWNIIRTLMKDTTEFQYIDVKMMNITEETDDILKNVSTERVKRAVWSINTTPIKEYHYAPYPKSLIETPIKACCQVNGTVLDMFMGSGTTGIVCKELNRNFIGIELNEEYYNIAKTRIEETVVRKTPQKLI